MNRRSFYATARRMTANRNSDGIPDIAESEAAGDERWHTEEGGDAEASSSPPSKPKWGLSRAMEAVGSVRRRRKKKAQLPGAGDMTPQKNSDGAIDEEEGFEDAGDDTRASATAADGNGERPPMFGEASPPNQQEQNEEPEFRASIGAPARPPSTTPSLQMLAENPRPLRMCGIRRMQRRLVHTCRLFLVLLALSPPHPFSSLSLTHRAHLGRARLGRAPPQHGAFGVYQIGFIRLRWMEVAAPRTDNVSGVYPSGGTYEEQVRPGLLGAAGDRARTPSYDFDQLSIAGDGSQLPRPPVQTHRLPPSGDPLDNPNCSVLAACLGNDEGGNRGDGDGVGGGGKAPGDIVDGARTKPPQVPNSWLTTLGGASPGKEKRGGAEARRQHQNPRE